MDNNTQNWDEMENVGTDNSDFTVTERYLDQQDGLGEQVVEQAKRTPWWLLSFVFHLILLFLLSFLVIGESVPRLDPDTIAADLAVPEELFPDPEPLPVAVEKTPPVVMETPKVEEVTEVTPVIEEVKIEEMTTVNTEDDFNESLDNNPDPMLLAETPVDSSIPIGTLGIGGRTGDMGSSGLGHRGAWKTGISRKYNPRIKETEAAVDTALEWLKRHQTIDTDFGKIINAEEPEKFGLWLQYHWYRECDSYKGPNKGGDNSNSAKYPGRCSVKKYKCNSQTSPDSWTSDEETKKRVEKHSMATTSLALLTYAGAGYSHKRGKYRKTIKPAVKLLTAVLNETKEGKMFDSENSFSKGSNPGVYAYSYQPTLFQKLVTKKIENLFDASAISKSWSDGSLNGNGQVMYQQCIMTLALNEIYGISRDSYLKQYCVDATQAVLASKGNPGWRYSYALNGHKRYSANSGVGDISVSTWAIMALKAANAVGILKDAAEEVGTDDKTVIKDLKKLVEADKAGDTKCYYALDPADGQANPSEGRIPLYISDVAFLYKGKTMLEKMKSRVDKLHINLKLNNSDPATSTGYWGKGGLKAEAHSPDSFARDYYFMYYNTLALFQYGGKTWDKYNEITTEWLVKNQHQAKKSCDNGSWEQSQSHSYGRVYNTTLCALQLQVYYRYKRNCERKKDAGKSSKK